MPEFNRRGHNCYAHNNHDINVPLGEVYIIPLEDGGEDEVRNVAIMCANGYHDMLLFQKVIEENGLEKALGWKLSRAFPKGAVEMARLRVLHKERQEIFKNS